MFVERERDKGVLIDDHSHAFLTVARLTAVHPERLRIGNLYGKCRKSCSVSGNWHEAGLDASHIGHNLTNGNTRMIEVGLGNGMVLRTS